MSAHEGLTLTVTCLGNDFWDLRIGKTWLMRRVLFCRVLWQQLTITLKRSGDKHGLVLRSRFNRNLLWQCRASTATTLLRFPASSTFKPMCPPIQPSESHSHMISRQQRDGLHPTPPHPSTAPFRVALCTGYHMFPLEIHSVMGARQMGCLALSA